MSHRTALPDVIDLKAVGANMYGCQPCPKCGSSYRYPTQDLVIHCDECGFETQGREAA